MIQFVILILLSGGFPVFANEDVSQSGFVPWTFLIQPYQGATVWIDGEAASATVLEVDKEIATLRINVPNRVFQLRVTKPGFRTYSVQSSPSESHVLASLDEDNSMLRFVRRVRTGSQPKSAIFLNEARVLLPLLEDSGIDVASVPTGPTQRIAPPPSFAGQKGFVEAALLPERGEVWISQMTMRSIHVFSLENLLFKASLTVPGQWGKVLLNDPDRKTVYFSNWMSKDISIIDAQDRNVVGSIPAGGVPRGMALSRDGQYIYVAQYGRENDEDKLGQVAKVSLVSKEIVRRIGSPGAKRHMVISNRQNRLYVSDMANNEISVIDLITDREIMRWKTFEKPNTIVLSPEEDRLFVSCRGKNNPESYLRKGPELGRIQIFEVSDGRLIGNIQAGNQPTGLAISPSGHWLVSTDFLDQGARVFEVLR